MEYKFKYKKNFFWRTIKVVGHAYDENSNKMILYKKKGEIEEIAKWSEKSLKLGVDWVLAEKRNMETESGQTIKLQQESN